MLRRLFILGCLSTAIFLTGCLGGHSRPAPAQSRAQPTSPATAGATWQMTDPSFTPLPGARALYGRLGGAVYEIEIPENWNGGLVMYAHGFAGNEPFLIVGPPPLRSYFIQEGFAWAASSFSDNGYDPQSGVDDTLALLAYFKQNVAQPARTYIYGTSMGGHVVVSSLEQHPDVYQGAFSECGVVAGVDEMDYLLGYAAVGQYLAGLNLLPVSNISDYESAVRTELIPTLGNPATKRLTQKGRAFESVIENLTGGPRPFRHEGFLDRFAGNFSVTFDELGGKTPAARAATNESQQYSVGSGFGVTSGQIDASVYREPPDASVRNPKTDPALAPMTGNLRTPLLSIHTTGDAFVPLSLEQDYRRAVDAAGNGGMLVQRAIRRPDHCQFSEAEREQSWDDLVRWVEQGVKPEGDDVLSADLSQIGLRWTNPLLPGDPGGL